MVVPLLSLLVTPVSPAQVQQARPFRDRMIRAIAANIGWWDSNKDGELTDQELYAAIQEPRMVGDAAAAAAALAKQYNSKKIDYPAFTGVYFQSEHPSIQNLVQAFKACLGRLEVGFRAPLYDGNGPSLDDCKQGNLGDCFLVAAVGAVVNRDPSTIMKMIKVDFPNQRYLVTFPDGVEVSVPPLTHGQLAYGGGRYTDGLWLRVVERAYAIRLVQLNRRNEKGPEISTVINGGKARPAAEALTGHTMRPLFPKDREATADEIRVGLKKALSERRVMLTSVSKEGIPQLPTGHVYAVIGYSEARDSVIVWNPWGNDFTPRGAAGPSYGYRTVDGRFEVPVAEFRLYFGGVGAETDEANSPTIK